jgi:hypothetical protein
METALNNISEKNSRLYACKGWTRIRSANALRPQISVVLDIISVVGYTRKDQVRYSNCEGEINV